MATISRPTTENTWDANRRVFTNLKYMYVTPWTDEATLGSTTYNLVNVVGDTTSVEQEDNEVNELEHEFSSTPLYENVSLGNKTFTTEAIDFQDAVLKELFGWTTDGSGNAFAPTTYKDLYVVIELGFNSTEDIVVLPKVKLNSKAVLSSMKTDASRATITGTCYKAYVKAGSMSAETDMATITSDNIEAYEIQATAFEDTGA